MIFLVFRVWKGILGIRDLAKIRCGIRENAKYLDGIRDLTATREAGFAKIWARDASFFACLSGIREIATTQVNVLAAKANQPGERKISMERPIYILNLLAFAEISLFQMYFWERKNGIRDSDEKVRDAGFF